MKTFTILAILAAVAIPLAKTAVKREKEIELRRSLRTIRDAIDAYKKLAEEYFKEPFREREIRKEATKRGLRVRGKIIGRNSSNGILRDLVNEEFLVRVDRGLFQHQRQKSDSLNFGFLRTKPPQDKGFDQ